MSKDDDRIARLKQIMLNMPEKPGSYQYYDKDGVIIYVGKAKNLKKRVSTYFHKEVDRYKTKLLVSKIWDITYTVVSTEEDALLLENSLIKQYNPRYNVLLKDGKTYPSICITKEPLPRIFSTRRIDKKYGQYFGPYSQVNVMYGLLDLIKKVMLPRRCNLLMTEEGIKEGKYRQCLEYHMHNCLGPCIGKQSVEDYQKSINYAREILRGNTRELRKKIYAEMEEKSSLMQFEEAEKLKQQYILLDTFVAKSEVVSYTITDVDVFSIIEDEVYGTAFINYMHVMNGTVNQSFTFEYKKKLDETVNELLLEAIPSIRERFQSKAKEIIVPFDIDWKMPDGSEFFVPQKGDKKHLVELSELNCRQYKVDRLMQTEKLNPEQRQVRLMKELQNLLGMETLPYRIECFDNSNISGTDAVAGCVVFKQMKPSKKDYRKFIIKTVEGPDDYASMQEVVRRKYSPLLLALQGSEISAEELPNLIICDGGIGQMNCVREVVEDELGLSIPIAGLAKNDRHRTNELLFGFPPKSIQIKTNSELFHVLTQIQDEVHRYAIQFHRDKRSKHALQSELDSIPGIGPKTKDLLLNELKSLKRIKDTDLQTLSTMIGKTKAEILYNFFHKNDDN